MGSVYVQELSRAFIERREVNPVPWGFAQLDSILDAFAGRIHAWFGQGHPAVQKDVGC